MTISSQIRWLSSIFSPVTVQITNIILIYLDRIIPFTMMASVRIFWLGLLWSTASSFVLKAPSNPIGSFLKSTETSDVAPSVETLTQLKADLVLTCSRVPKPESSEMNRLVEELENTAEQVGLGQASSISGLLSGEWELLYSPMDATRSSPFFWAFRQAFPDNSDQIFSITDSIPESIKDIGPAFQQIELDSSTQSGSFTSRVKVATLGGMATSMMTTRGSIVSIEGLDGIRLRIETTKPEDSTVVSKVFGPLGDMINANLPPFPSGEALERAQPGSSEVVMRTTFCDEGLRISRNDDRPSEVFVWRRREFASFDFL
jgi:hypothetical protein